MHRPEPRLILPEPPEALKDMSRQLVGRMRDRERDTGFLSFAAYMEMALYEPGLGYYSAGLPKLGEQGDFITAPELGSVFARCLARQIAAVGNALGESWDILEIGAGSGRLAADLLAALAALGTPPRRYGILERSADLRAEQARTIETRLAGTDGSPHGLTGGPAGGPAGELAGGSANGLADGLADRVSWLDAPPAKDSAGDESWRGVLIANEVIDALAVERFEIGPDGPRQLGVTFGEGGEPSTPTWTHRPAPRALDDRIRSVQERLPQALPIGYRSELCLTLPAWLASVTDALETGLALFIDYGYPRSEYYQPDRRDGTLVCQMRHRAHFDPFVWPGLQDLSAFVDFTALAEAADGCGLTVSGYAPQNHFLIGCGLEPVMVELLEAQMAGEAGQAGRAEYAQQALSHEIRQLTLPGAMGEKFQVMGLTRGDDLPLPGFQSGSWLDRL